MRPRAAIVPVSEVVIQLLSIVRDPHLSVFFRF
jgi:hypothetical protein